jgi:DtxR family Mn-dependent transcriptional regulator
VITREREDYLKAIYKLQAEEIPVRTTSIAEALEVEPGSVTGVIKRLGELKLVNYERYRGVTLTQAGEKVALEIIRHHRLLELYLMEALGYSWDEVDAEAEKLEHVISEQFEERIATLLGDPALDPHGSPIPTKDGEIHPHDDVPLSELEAGQQATVSRVNEDDPELLRYLAELGLRPQTPLQVVEVAPFGGTVHIMIGDAKHALGPDVTSQIFVKSDE